MNLARRASLCRMSRFFARKFVRHRRLNAWGLSFKNGYGAILCLWEIGLWQMLFLWPWAWGLWKGRGDAHGMAVRKAVTRITGNERAF